MAQESKMLTPRAIVQKDFRSGTPEECPSVPEKADEKPVGNAGDFWLLPWDPPRKPSFLEVFMVNSLHF